MGGAKIHREGTITGVGLGGHTIEVEAPAPGTIPLDWGEQAPPGVDH